MVKVLLRWETLFLVCLRSAIAQSSGCEDGSKCSGKQVSALQTGVAKLTADAAAGWGSDWHNDYIVFDCDYNSDVCLRHQPGWKSHHYCRDFERLCTDDRWQHDMWDCCPKLCKEVTAEQNLTAAQKSKLPTPPCQQSLSACGHSSAVCLDCKHNSDACLRKQHGWAHDSTCEGSKMFCSDANKAYDMHSCCPGVCDVEADANSEAPCLLEPANTCGRSTDTCMNCAQNSDACLRSRKGWSNNQTCANSQKWCAIKPRSVDMMECCPQTCGAENEPDAPCHQVGKCGEWDEFCVNCEENSDKCLQNQVGWGTRHRCKDFKHLCGNHKWRYDLLNCCPGVCKEEGIALDDAPCSKRAGTCAKSADTCLNCAQSSDACLRSKNWLISWTHTCENSVHMCDHPRFGPDMLECCPSECAKAGYGIGKAPCKAEGCGRSAAPCKDCNDFSDLCLRAKPGWTNDKDCLSSGRFCNDPRWGSDLEDCCPKVCHEQNSTHFAHAACMETTATTTTIDHGPTTTTPSPEVMLSYYKDDKCQELAKADEVPSASRPADFPSTTFISNETCTALGWKYNCDTNEIEHYEDTTCANRKLSIEGVHEGADFTACMGGGMLQLVDGNWIKAYRRVSDCGGKPIMRDKMVKTWYKDPSCLRVDRTEVIAVNSCKTVLANDTDSSFNQCQGSVCSAKWTCDQGSATYTIYPDSERCESINKVNFLDIHGCQHHQKITMCCQDRTCGWLD